ncbi:MAG: sugar transferase [Chloroflexi bacterium]|nr:sugar transferase [Chloroflexota bacterium]
MKERRLFLALIDLLLVNAAVIIAFVVWSSRGDKELRELLTTQTYWFGALTILWLGCEYLSGLYDLRVVARLRATTRALAQTFLLVLVAYLAIFFSLPTELPRGIVVYHGVAAIVLIALWRGAYIRAALFRRRALIVGAGNAGREIARTIQAQFQPHYDLAGFVDDDPAKQGHRVEGLPVLGARADLTRLIAQQRVAEIILAITRDLSDDLFHALLDAQELGVEIVPMPILFERITGRVPVEYIGESWYVALPLSHASSGELYRAIKRAIDLAFALIGLLVFVLLLPFIALAIRLDSPGAIFYSQPRVGQGGRIFTVRKLRTMVRDAERAGQAVWAARNDPRVTRVGRFLRRLHLDEVPQFWNVLRGEMSIVGPRPERPEFVAQLEKQIPFYRLRHAVKPGIAGWAITHSDYVDNVDDARLRVEYDLYYIKHQSLGLDVWILFRTVWHVLAFKGR